MQSILVKSLIGYLLSCLLLLSANAAQDPFAGANTDTVFGSSQEQEFLPVEEAYILSPSIDDGRILLHWDIAPGYYLYQEKFKFTQIGADGERGLTPAFEPGKRIFDEYFNKELTVYYQETQVEFPLDSDQPFELKMVSQGCADAGLCYPPRTQYLQVDPGNQIIVEKPAQDTGLTSSQTALSQADVPQTASQPLATPVAEAPFLLGILLAALLGGVILNLMPCVFPVLSLKALSFASNHLSRHKQHVHGWAYTLGVVGSFLVAAAIILIARGAGETVGWGFQLQSPIFVTFMVYLFFTMSLSLIGLFQLGTRMMGVGQSLTSGHGLRASFFTGVLAALVASPCTAPLMATALGFAMTQPAPVALLIFATLGFGMALPFLLLSYSPQLAKRLPQPGVWMENLKQLLAFPLLLTCVWLLWVLGHQVSSDAVIAVVLGTTAIAFGCWLWQKAPISSIWRIVVRSIAVAAIAFALIVASQIERLKEPASDQWISYSPSTLAELRAQGTPVLVNMTADWCITCLANDRIALGTELVQTTADSLGVVMLKGDWTNTDPAITAFLQQFGRSGVPLYVMYPSSTNEPGEVLPQILTPQSVVQAMERATSN